jgi:deoxyribonuclease V
MNSKYVACDVQYVGDTGFAAGICFNSLTDEFPGRVAQAVVCPVADYMPGEFYRRELPCLLELLRTLEGVRHFCKNTMLSGWHEKDTQAT